MQNVHSWHLFSSHTNLLWQRIVSLLYEWGRRGIWRFKNLVQDYMMEPDFWSRTVWFQLRKCFFPVHLGRTLKPCTWAHVLENKSTEATVCSSTHVLIMVLDPQLSEFLFFAGAPQTHCILPFTLPPPTFYYLMGGWQPLMFLVVYRYVSSHLPKLGFVISLKNFCDQPRFLILSILVLYVLL